MFQLWSFLFYLEVLSWLLYIFPGLPLHRGLSQHPHTWLSVPVGPHQTQTLGRVGVNSQFVSFISNWALKTKKTTLYLLCDSLSTKVVLVAFRDEEFPDNILQATANLKTVNIIPAIGKLTLNLKRWCNAQASIVVKLCRLQFWTFLLTYVNSWISLIKQANGDRHLICKIT